MQELIYSKTLVILIVYAAVAIALGRFAKPGQLRDWSFATINLSATFLVYFWEPHQSSLGLYPYPLLLGFFSILYLLIKKNGSSTYPYWFLAFLPALIWLAISKVTGLLTVVGISYSAFRIAHVVWELQTGRVKANQIRYPLFISHVFFLPTFLLGPISPFSFFLASYERESNDRTQVPVLESALRILKGAAKFVVVAGIFYQLTPDSLLADYRVHKWYELIIAAYAFYIYLYANFSGANDLTIGTAGLMGISVKENFDRPYLATNNTDFWRRWHISLSEWFREIVFSPLLAGLLRNVNWLAARECVAFALMFTFVLLGWWHGNGWQFWLVGLAIGFGVVFEHYMNSFKMTKRLKVPIVLQWLVTHTYLALSISLMSINWQSKGITFHGLLSKLMTFAHHN